MKAMICPKFRRAFFIVLCLFICTLPSIAQNPWMVPFSGVNGGPPNTFFINTMKAIVAPATTPTTSNSFAVVTDRRGYTYVGSATNSVIAISPITFTQVASYTSGAVSINNPVGMAISPDNKYLYVTNYLNGPTNAIAVFDISIPGTLVPVKNITLTGGISGNPGWMDIDAAGNLYIALESSPGLAKVVNPSGATPTISAFITGDNTYNGSGAANLPTTHSIAVDKVRNLVYVSSQDNAVVQVWSTAGVKQNVVYRYTSTGASSYIHGIALSPDGNSLYLTSISSSQAYRFNTVTSGLPQASGSANIPPANTSAAVPNGNARAVSITPDGAKLYLFGDSRVLELNPTTLATITTFPVTYGRIDPHGYGAILNDYGDAPASYGKAGHSLNNANFTNGLLKIGDKADGDSTINTTSANAAFDDNSNPTAGITDDEDAFAGTNAPDVMGSSYSVSIPVLNNTGSAANLVVWVDFNRDGDFADAGETSSLVSVPASASSQNVTVNFSGYTSVPGASFMRIRLSTDAALTATAANARDVSFWDGEVEDFPVNIILKINPDFNSGYVNQVIKGNLSTNDGLPSGYSYGTVTAANGNPDGGTAKPTVNADGTYTFTSATPGVYNFDVQVCNGGSCVTNHLTITVAADPLTATTPNPPVANPDIASTTAGQPVTLNTLGNDQPGAGNGKPLDPTSVTVPSSGTGAPQHGTVSVDPATGNITYTPAPGFTGTDTYSYTVCDKGNPAQCTTSYQQITIDPAGTNNTSASDDYNTGKIGATMTGNVLTNDVDAQGQTQTVTNFGGQAVPAVGSSAPVTVYGSDGITAVGTVTMTSTGNYTFTPAQGTTYVGPLNVPYSISDGNGATASATLYLLITPDKALPVLFGPISAYWKDGVLHVKWNTLTEENCKEYIVEGSIDGKNWKALGAVLSKAANGTSTTPLDYEFSTSAGALAVAGIGLAGLLLLPSVRRKRTKWLVAIAAVLTIAACTKQVADEIATGDQPAYIRIAQKDIDGTLRYSKVHKVETE